MRITNVYPNVSLTNTLTPNPAAQPVRPTALPATQHIASPVPPTSPSTTTTASLIALLPTTHHLPPSANNAPSIVTNAMTPTPVLNAPKDISTSAQPASPHAPTNTTLSTTPA